jgi:hypothetical protein
VAIEVRFGAERARGANRQVGGEAKLTRRRLERGADLAQHLVFAEDDRFEAGGDGCPKP